MPNFEYKVVPAPVKGQKAKGVKTPEGRFALSVETVLNQMGAEGWEYLRAELLPSDERSGLTGSTTNWRNVLVFRRALAGDVEQFQPRVLETPAPVPVAEPVADPAPALATPDASDIPDAVPGKREPPRLATGAERMLKDNGVEELSDVAGMTAALKSRAEQKTELSVVPDGSEGDEKV